MAELKTKSNDDSVVEFIEKVPDETKKKDCQYLLQLMETTTGSKPKLWSGGMVGFGDWHYKYESGREGDWFIMGFAPRKQNLTIYLMDGFGKYNEMLGRLGKHKTGKSCLYIKRLEDIDLKVLAQLVRSSFDYFVEKHGIQKRNMKGIVFTEFFEFVESKDGYEMVDSVLQDTGSSGVYTAVGSYPFEEMLSVMVAYSKRSATEITDILYQFGRHLLRAFHTNYNFFFSKSQSAFEFLNSIDGYIHIEVAKLYPDAQLPTFSVSHHTEKKMELIYESERKLAHLALGLIDETLLYFKEEGRVDMVVLEKDHSKVKFTITKI